MGYGSIKIHSEKDLRQKMINYVVANTDLTDLLEGSVLSQILAAAARSDESIYFQIARVLDVFSIDRATGEDLDLRMADYGITRDINVYASGSGSFKRTAVADAFTVPMGTEIQAGGYVYRTTSSAAFGAGNASSAAVTFVAVQVGSGPNTSANTDMTVLTSFSDAAAGGLTFTLASAITGGADAESDKLIRSRAKALIRKLNRTSPDALAAICTTASLNGEKCTSAKVVESLSNPGRVLIYIDNGGGLVPTETTVVDESLTAAATGGEVRFRVQNIPIKWLGAGPGANQKILLKKNGAALTLDTDFWVKSGTGQIVLKTGLAATDTLTATYTHWSGLVQEVQKHIDGNASDTATYKGGRAAGADVIVLAPSIVTPTIAASVTVDAAYNGSTVRTEVQTSIINYINGLGVGEDVILAQIMEEGMLVTGVTNMVITTPAPSNPPADIAIADNENARATTTSVTIT